MNRSLRMSDSVHPFMVWLPRPLPGKRFVGRRIFADPMMSAEFDATLASAAIED
jgi:hypothetical protein